MLTAQMGLGEMHARQGTSLGNIIVSQKGSGWKGP